MFHNIKGIICKIVMFIHATNSVLGLGGQLDKIKKELLFAAHFEKVTLKSPK